MRALEKIFGIWWSIFFKWTNIGNVFFNLARCPVATGKLQHTTICAWMQVLFICLLAENQFLWTLSTTLPAVQQKWKIISLHGANFNSWLEKACGPSDRVRNSQSQNPAQLRGAPSAAGLFWAAQHFCNTHLSLSPSLYSLAWKQHTRPWSGVSQEISLLLGISMNI